MERSEVGLKYLPQPDYLDFSLPVTHVTLITNEGSDLTTKVFSQLEANGHKVVVLNLPNVANPVKVNSINLASHSDEAIKEAIEAIRKQFGEVGSFTDKTFSKSDSDLSWIYLSANLPAP